MALTNAERQAKHRASKSSLTYRQALAWIIANDDYEWIGSGIPSIAACFIADSYGRDTDQVIADLRKMKEGV